MRGKYLATLIQVPLSRATEPSLPTVDAIIEHGGNSNDGRTSPGFGPNKARMEANNLTRGTTYRKNQAREEQMGYGVYRQCNNVPEETKEGLDAVS